MRSISAGIAHLDGASLRQAAGLFATGVTVVTTGSGSDFHATTVNAFTSLSLNPPLVIVCLSKTSRLHRTLLENAEFVVNILSAGQLAVAKTCASKTKDLSAVETMTRNAVTTLAGNLVAIRCELETHHDGGDHTIFVGRVIDIIEGGEGVPLLFFNGEFSGAKEIGDLKDG